MSLHEQHRVYNLVGHAVACMQLISISHEIQKVWRESPLPYVPYIQ